MGKHRSLVQEKIFVDFMESHQDLARGYVKGDKVVAESNWSQLVEKLNSSGPPTKDCNGWKKMWEDWKVYVKKKLCHNKKENLKTGGGLYNKYVLSDIEESLAMVCGLHRSVEGIEGARAFGEGDLNVYLTEIDKENGIDDLDEMPSTSKAVKRKPLSTNMKKSCLENTMSPSDVRLSRTPSPDPKRFRPCTPKNDLNSLLKEENTHLKSIALVLQNQETHIKLDQIANEIKLQNHKLDRLCDILENYFKAKQLNELEKQKKLQEKHELKLKLLEIETLKLQLERQKANSD